MNNDHKADTSISSDEGETMLESVAHDVKSAASRKLHDSIDAARAQANDAKADVADEVKDVATALQHVSEELRSGSAQSRTLGQISSTLADASESIRERDLGEIIDMINSAGRRNPVLFLGGAAILGFAASRYAKASGRHAHASHDRNRQPETQAKAFGSAGNPDTQPGRPGRATP